VKDFAAVGLIGNSAYMLVVEPSLPAKTVSEFVALAKARPWDSLSCREITTLRRRP